MTEQPSLFAVKPIIKYPREAQVGKTYLMTIDLQPEEGFEWQYDEEEYPIYCSVDSELFSSKPIGEPVVVLHRFGGSYGEAKFLLTAIQESLKDELRVVLINKWGVPVKDFTLSDVQVKQDLLNNGAGFLGHYHISHESIDGNVEIEDSVEAELSSLSSSPLDRVFAAQRVSELISSTILDTRARDDLSYEQLSQEIQQQIFDASQRYVQNYTERYGLLKVLGMREPVKLESVYTSVHLLNELEVQQFDSLEDLEAAYRQKRYGLLAPRSNRNDGLKTINEQQFLMVLGGPGAGKSTLLRRAGLEVLRGSEGSYKYECLPIMLELKRFTGAKDGLETAIETIISQELEVCGFPDAENLTEKLLERGKLLCLLDGLDEVFSSNSAAVIDQISNFVYKYNSNRYIISCRISAYRSRLPSFVEAAIADFDDRQIQDFIVNWFHSEIDKQAGKAHQCWSLLQQPQNAAVKEIAQTPLLLAFLCMVYDRIQDLPANRSTLYNKALDILIEEWAAEKRVLRDPIHEQWSAALEKDLLSKIAYDSFANDRYFFTWKELINTTNDFLASISANSRTLNAEALLNAIIIQQGVIVERTENVFSFSHLTFQEYLTAYCVSQELNLLNQSIEYHLNDYRWREVFLNLVGMRQKSDELLLLMEAKAQKYIRSAKLQSLITWSNQVTTGSTGEFRPAAKRAMAIFIVLDLGLALILDSTNTYGPDSDNARPNSFQFASDLGLKIDFSREYTPDFVHDLTYGNALERALQLAYEFQQIAVFNQNMNFSSLINDLEILKAQSTVRESQYYGTAQSLSNQALEIWFSYISLEQNLINLSVEEETALADYFYSMSLIIKSKEVATRLSPEIWNEMERRMLLSSEGNTTSLLESTIVGRSENQQTASQEVSQEEVLDTKLRQLILEVKQQPSKSIARRQARATNRFLIEVQRLPGIVKSNHQDYLAALNQTLLWLVDSIDNFSVDTPSIQADLPKWVNSYLQYKIKNLFSPNMKRIRQKLNETFADEEEEEAFLEELDRIGVFDSVLEASDDQQTLLLEQTQSQGLQVELRELQEYIQLDLDGNLRSIHIKGNPRCNVQLLIQRRIFQEKSWKELSQELGVSLPSLSSFWARQAAPRLREIGERFLT